MTLTLRSETNAEWSAKFNADLDIVKIWYQGVDVSKRIIGKCWEDVVYKRFEEKFNLDYERFCEVFHID